MFKRFRYCEQVCLPANKFENNANKFTCDNYAC